MMIFSASSDEIWKVAPLLTEIVADAVVAVSEALYATAEKSTVEESGRIKTALFASVNLKDA